MLPLALLLAGAASAYETDQLTERDVVLADAAPSADMEMDRVLDEAIAATNAKLQCNATTDRTRQVLVDEIHARTGVPVPMPSKPFPRSEGYTAYQGWLETDPSIDRRDFLDRSDIYGGMSLPQSVVLRLAGPCSTIRLAGHDVGTDKIDHFFNLGYEYWRLSDGGKDPEKALRWGTDTEWTVYGMLTSRAFSFADLAANEAGYRFYTSLMKYGSVVQQEDDGCVTRVRDFSWADWATDDWDEVWNPSVYAPIVQKAVDERLFDERATICAEYETWDSPAYESRMDALPPHPYYTAGKVPARIDPFDLVDLCR